MFLISFSYFLLFSSAFSFDPLYDDRKSSHTHFFWRKCNVCLLLSSSIKLVSKRILLYIIFFWSERFFSWFWFDNRIIEACVIKCVVKTPFYLLFTSIFHPHLLFLHLALSIRFSSFDGVKLKLSLSFFLTKYTV